MDLFSSRRHLGVFMKDNGFAWRVIVVAVREPADSNGDLFPLKDHRLVGVIGHAHRKVTAGETESRCPKRLQLRHVRNHRRNLGLGSVAQVAGRHCALKIASRARVSHK